MKDHHQVVITTEDDGISVRDAIPIVLEMIIGAATWTPTTMVPLIVTVRHGITNRNEIRKTTVITLVQTVEKLITLFPNVDMTIELNATNVIYMVTKPDCAPTRHSNQQTVC